jgi:hypothetical protein
MGSGKEIRSSRIADTTFTPMLDTSDKKDGKWGTFSVNREAEGWTIRVKKERLMGIRKGVEGTRVGYGESGWICG